MKCLCFPIFFLYYGNVFFPCFGNCMDFYFTQNVLETHNLGMFVFPHSFHVLWEHTFPMLQNFYGFLIRPKYLRNPWIWNVCVFLYFSCTMEIDFSHILGIEWINVSHKIYQKPIALECLCFPIRFLYVFGIVWVSISHKIEECRICKKPKLLEYLFFPIIFPC